MKILNKIALFTLCFTFHLSSIAQGCSTCRAQIINSTNDDLTVGNGLNIGILFLMVIPYIILFVKGGGKYSVDNYIFKK